MTLKMLNRVRKMDDQQKWFRGDWIQTFSGKAFFPLDPQLKDIEIVDIAHSLSNMCRYAGHCKKFYSVAEHCVLLARFFSSDPKLALWALLHDASEAYLVDIPRPIKPYLTNYKEIEAGLMAKIAEYFQLDPVMPEIISDADKRILLDEYNQNMNKSDQIWGIAQKGNAILPLGIKLELWRPEEAKREFLFEYHRLCALVDNVG